MSRDFHEHIEKGRKCAAFELMSAPVTVSHLRAGFGPAFVALKPGRDVFMHIHDTVETFMVMRGTWKVSMGTR